MRLVEVSFPDKNFSMVDKTEINKILGLVKEVSDYETSFSWTSMMFPSGS